jgi:hypothetical protein
MYEPEITYEPARAPMTVTPEMDFATGEVLESTVHFTSDKDAYLYNDELIEEEQVQQEQQTEDGIHIYSVEEADRLLDEERDDPNQELAEVSWNLDLPDNVPGLDLVQVLATRYLAQQMTYEEALDEAFSHGLSEQQLLRAYSLYNAAYNKALGR